MEKKPKRKKKLNKEARDKARQQKADIYLQGFNHGYSMGIAEGMKKN